MVFGDKRVLIVGGVPTRADTLPRPAPPGATRAVEGAFEPAAPGAGGNRSCAPGSNASDSASPAGATSLGGTSETDPLCTASRRSWFRTVVRLPELTDRVWDARLIYGSGDLAGGTDGFSQRGKTRDKEEGEGEGEGVIHALNEDRRSTAVGMVAVALAHNCVEASVTLGAREHSTTLAGTCRELGSLCSAVSGDVPCSFSARLCTHPTITTRCLRDYTDNVIADGSNTSHRQGGCRNASQYIMICSSDGVCNFLGGWVIDGGLPCPLNPARPKFDFLLLNLVQL